MLIYSSARCQVRRHGEDCPNQGCADARGALDRDTAGPRGISRSSPRLPMAMIEYDYGLV